MKMKNFIYTIQTMQRLIFISFSLILISCEDVIEIELTGVDPAMVIEAGISDDGSVSTVFITKSTDFFEPGVYENVSNAIVTISDDDGNSYQMIEVDDGEYHTDLITGESGSTYSIEVNSDGQIYNAESSMPEKLVLDSLSLELAPSRPGEEEGEERYFLHIYFKDTPGVDNYARFRIFVEDELLTGFIVYEDKFTDGNDIDVRIILDNKELDLKIGDLIEVELLSIDKASYDFYKTANGVNASGSSTGGGPSSTGAAPSNPITNWNNNALGFFSAYTVSGDSIIFEK
jgi:hypothetical protein